MNSKMGLLIKMQMQRCKIGTVCVKKTKTQEDIYVTENFTFDQRSAADRVVGKNSLDSVSANRYYEGMGMGDMEDMQKDKVYGRDILKPETLHSSRV